MAPASTAFLARSIRVMTVVLLVLWPAATPAASSAAPGPVLGFVLPVAPPPVVLTPFRAPDTSYSPGHRGVDLAAATGATVLAAGPGRVVFAGTLAGRGVLSIEHEGGMRTTYEPVTATVRAGRAVTAGEVIGTLQPGHPGCAPATCLHWGARLPDRLYLDPMSLLGPWDVRLLPWDGR
ncbi:M23 family metallopeptidase [Nakamurella sp. GG22]